MRSSLTTLVTLIFISTATGQPTPTSDESKAMDLIARAGGKAEIDPKLPAAGRVAAKFENAGDAVFFSLKKLPQVGSIDIYDASKCTDKGLAACKDLPYLRRLILSKSKMNTATVNAIAECKELRVLRLPSSGLSDGELSVLKTLTLLEELDISDNVQITDKGMATVKTFERLQSLYLGKTALTDKGLMELKALDGLRSLNVGATKVTADAAEKFVDVMPNLRIVRR